MKTTIIYLFTIIIFLSCTQNTSSTLENSAITTQEDIKGHLVTQENIPPNIVVEKDIKINPNIKKNAPLKSEKEASQKSLNKEITDISYEKKSFIPEMQNNSQPTSTKKQIAQAKDMVIASKNEGIVDFRKGNVNFLGYAKHKKAITYYKLALEKGIENKNMRKECYVNLAVCLFQNKQTIEAKELIIYTSLIYSNLVISAGEQATRDTLQKYIHDANNNN